MALQMWRQEIMPPALKEDAIVPSDVNSSSINSLHAPDATARHQQLLVLLVHNRLHAWAGVQLSRGAMQMHTAEDKQQLIWLAFYAVCRPLL